MEFYEEIYKNPEVIRLYASAMYDISVTTCVCRKE